MSKGTALDPGLPSEIPVKGRLPLVGFGAKPRGQRVVNFMQRTLT
jgi:hypothetical protein